MRGVTVVVSDVALQDGAEMTAPEDEDAIEALVTQRSHEPFRARVCLTRARCQRKIVSGRTNSEMGFRLHGRGRLRHLTSSAAVAEPRKPDHGADRVSGTHTFRGARQSIDGQPRPFGKWVGTD